MTALLPNPTGAGYFNLPSIGGLELEVQVDSSQATALPLGSLVEIVNYTGPGTGARSTPPTIKASSTTADFKLLGIVTAGGNSEDANGVVSVAAGQVAKVAVIGSVVQALFDANNTTAGHLAVQSTTTAGTCTDSATATAGKTVGVILQAVTIATGTALVWILVRPS
jgi:hypothetical protein